MKPIDHFSKKKYSLIEGVITELYFKSSLLTKKSRIKSDLSHAVEYLDYSIPQSDHHITSQRFVCVVDDYLVCGHFSGASMLPEGSYVKLAVKREGNLLVADGILLPRRGWMWLGYDLEIEPHCEKLDRLMSKTPLYLLIIPLIIFTMILSTAITFLIAIMYVKELIRPTRPLGCVDAPFKDIMGLWGFGISNHMYLEEFSYSSAPLKPTISSIGYGDMRSVFIYQRALESGQISIKGKPKFKIPELKQRKVEGIIRHLNTHPPEYYFKDDGWLKDDLMTFSTWRGGNTFRCFIDNQPVCGSFYSAEYLKEGDYVTASVYDRHNITIATGIRSEAQGLVWAAHPRAPDAERSYRYKGYGIFALTVWGILSFLGATFIFLGAPSYLFGIFSIMGLIIGLLYTRKWLTHKPRTQEDIWHAPIMARAMMILGFARPFSIHLTKKYYANRGKEKSQLTDVFSYKKAAADGQLSLNKSVKNR